MAERDLLRAERLGLPGRVAGVSFALRPGESALLLGASGSGKTSVLDAVIGRHSGERDGALWRFGVPIPARDIGASASPLGWVPQDPRAVLAPAHPWPALGTLTGRAPPAADTFGLPADAAMRPAGSLSRGEARRAALAWALGAPVLVLDEPTEDLDAPRAQAVIDALVAARARGAAILAATHDPRLIAALGGPLLILSAGRVVEQVPDLAAARSEAGARVADALLPAPPAGRPRPAAPPSPGSGPLTLPPGARVWLDAPSGRGKTSWIHALAGIPGPRADAPRWALSPDPRIVQLLPQDPAALCPPFQRVRAAVEETLRLAARAGVPRSDALPLLGQWGLAARAEALAGALSGGERRRLAALRVCAMRPKVLLADEPTAGLDPPWAAHTVRALDAAVGPEGALVVASHDPRVGAWLGAVRWHIGQDGLPGPA
jgi:peptide/nickel transport system ATP-binding protein